MISNNCGRVRWALVALCLACAMGMQVAPSSAQSPDVLRGVVRDSLTGAPLEGVVVRLLREDAYTISTGPGAFRLGGLAKGMYLIQFSRLGYADAIRYVRVPQEGQLVVNLQPVPVRLEAIQATSNKLHRDALRNAHTVGGFFRAFNREDIVTSGAVTALEFLDIGAGMPIRYCEKSSPEKGLCTIIPFLHPSDLGSAGRVYNARGVGGSGFASSAPVRGARGIDGIRRTTGPPVFLDDEYLRGGLNALALLGLADVERVETYGARGEAQIRVYTSGYIDLLATGEKRPTFWVPRLEYFQSSIWADSVGGAKHPDASN